MTDLDFSSVNISNSEESRGEEDRDINNILTIGVLSINDDDQSQKQSDDERVFIGNDDLPAESEITLPESKSTGNLSLSINDDDQSQKQSDDERVFIGNDDLPAESEITLPESKSTGNLSLSINDDDQSQIELLKSLIEPSIEIDTGELDLNLSGDPVNESLGDGLNIISLDRAENMNKIDAQFFIDHSDINDLDNNLIAISELG